MPGQILNEQEIIVAYADEMMELRRRLRYVQNVFEHKISFNDFPFYVQVEFVALHFRKIFEIIILANIIVNVDEYSKKRKDYERNWSAKRII